jgi:hypothetical protein
VRSGSGGITRLHAAPQVIERYRVAESIGVVIATGPPF